MKLKPCIKMQLKLHFLAYYNIEVQNEILFQIDSNQTLLFMTREESLFLLELGLYVYSQPFLEGMIHLLGYQFLHNRQSLKNGTCIISFTYCMYQVHHGHVAEG